MADNKQYITQEQESGNIMISEEVIATIVSHAVNEVEGVVSLSAKPGADIIELLGKKVKGLKVVIAESGDVTIDCNITVCYGQNVVNVASAVQKAVAGAVESMSAIKVNAVNVNVCEIVRQ